MIKDYRPAERIPTWEQVHSLLIDLEERKEYLAEHPFPLTNEGIAMFNHYVKEIRSIEKLVEAIQAMNFYKPKSRSQRAI
jgi:hypothetical protein